MRLIKKFDGKKVLIRELLKTDLKRAKDFLDFINSLVEVVREKEVNQRVKSMLNTLKSLQPTESEKEVAEILEELKIPFTLHANVEGAKRFLNIDIAISCNRLFVYQ
ncbi:MAG: hypothetical protein ACP5F8_01095 [Candidatus Aenigmatarchaeota archaeon]